MSVKDCLLALRASAGRKNRPEGNSRALGPSAKKGRAPEKATILLHAPSSVKRPQRARGSKIPRPQKSIEGYEEGGTHAARDCEKGRTDVGPIKRAHAERGS
ncbi:hypothetical protein NDU88_004054 [Pleurodeles waltl]|uniref:Uncharacterized protein n=1 Tax=Pleurodeles waltl TaxID=8319 RepID=A0AAV7UF22_PLEWA|nr:hypothetical protein NDU88_004054 [Pleurodeles waltl]